MPIEYELRLFLKRPIYCLTNNIVESLKVSLIKWLFDHIIYEINPPNADFDDVPFGGDESLIPRRRLYCINDNILFRLKNGLAVDV